MDVEDILVHKANPMDLKTGDQSCARCGVVLHHVDMSQSEFKRKPELARSSGISPDCEIAISPLTIVGIDDPVPEGFARCAPAQKAKTEQPEGTKADKI